MKQFTTKSSTMRYSVISPLKAGAFCGLHKPKIVFPWTIPVRKAISVHSLTENKYQECANVVVKDSFGKAADKNLVMPNFALALWLLSAFPAEAATEAPFGGPPASSYYVSLGLFLMTLPGEWHAMHVGAQGNFPLDKPSAEF
jgi:hypothetical protein